MKRLHRYALLGIPALIVLMLLFPGLFMVPEEEVKDHATMPEPERWACPMLCVVLEFDGLCPVCGMDLENIGIAADAVTVSALERELIGLTLARVEPLRLETRLVLPGVVRGAETSRSVITAWTTGRIERFQAPAVGERVRAGTTVAWIYSAELIEAQHDLLSAVRTGYDDLLRGARHRLSQLGVSRETVARIEDTGMIMESLPVVSRFTGTVMRRLVENGDWVRSGQVLLEVADLNDIWIEAYLLEGQAGLLHVGDTVTVRSASRTPTATAGVTHVNPYLDPVSRTVTARLVAEGAPIVLLPGERVQIILTREAGDDEYGVPAVPASSVLSLGTRSVVYVLSPDSAGAPPPTRIPSPALGVRLEPRVIEVGPLSYSREGERFYPVLTGLQPGEIVAVHGAFLLDSQAELTGLPSLMTGPANGPD